MSLHDRAMLHLGSFTLGAFAVVLSTRCHAPNAPPDAPAAPVSPSAIANELAAIPGCASLADPGLDGGLATAVARELARPPCVDAGASLCCPTWLSCLADGGSASACGVPCSSVPFE